MQKSTRTAPKHSPKPRRIQPKRAPRVGLVSLGCPKALVDSERIITKLRAQGYELSADYAGADVVVVNTCGFLNSAKQESLEAIGEAVAENGRVVVRPVMNMGVTFDHRFMDGFHGGAMLQLFRAYLEDPARFDSPEAPGLAAVTTSQRS